MATKRRKLAAILSADIVGFSRLMEDDEAATVRALKAYRALFSEHVGRCRGRVVNMPGDALLAEFASAVDAVECAAAVQCSLEEQNRARDPHRRMQCRIGVNLGDVVEDGRSLLGDGVNIAARLESLADAGGVCISSKVFDEIDGKVDLDFTFAGEHQVKNISVPLRVYKLQSAPSLRLRLLGEMELLRGSKRLDLPQSKKTRALLAYLAVTQQPQRRDRLCRLLWDVADDPRAALRWSLTKLRPLVDHDGQPRLISEGATIRFALDGMDIDLFRIRAVLDQHGDAATVEELTELAGEFRGELLEGLELPDFNDFQIWCARARADARALHGRILSVLIDRLADQPERALSHARTLAQIDPLNEHARASLIRLLCTAGRSDEAREQAESIRRQLGEIGAEPGDELRDACAEVARAPCSATGDRHTTTLVATVPPPTARPATAMVGRVVEKQTLFDALESAARQRTLQTVLLLGEPGIGKTRLLTELMTEAGSRGGTVLDGCSYEVETSRPYGPWIDALRRLPPVAIGNALGPDLAPLLPELGDSAPTQHTRDRLFGAVVDLIAARAHSAPPVLLVLDDVHWCDGASAELLHYVVRMNRHRPVLVALAARDGELHDNEPMSRVLGALRRDGGVDEVSIVPLTAAETATLVQPLSPHSTPDQVYAASAGNPLFALELARAQPQSQDAVPSTLRQLVRDRIDRLPADAAEALRWSALLGQTFAVQRLTALAPFEIERVVAALEALERHGLLRTAAGTQSSSMYAFAHDVVRQVVHAEISEPRRRLMHLRVTKVLQGLSENDERIADLAHHAALAGEADIAARACLSAGRRYVRLFAGAEADAIARRGMHYAQQLSQPDQVKLQLELAEVRYTARRPRDTDDASREVEALAQQALDHGCLEHARLGFHILAYLRWEGGDWSDAQRHMMRAEQVSRSGDPRERVVALAEAARCLTMLERDLGHAEALLLEASALATRLGIEPTAIPDALGMLRLHAGQLDEAAQQFAHARDVCRREQDRLGEYRALEHLIVLEMQRQRFDAARLLIAELVGLGERLREGSELPFARALAVVCEYARTEDARAPLDAALTELRLVDAKQRLSFVLMTAAVADLARADAVRARARAEEALQLAEQLNRPSDVVWARTLLARAAAMLGDHAALAQQQRTLSPCALRGVSAAARAAAKDVLGETSADEEGP